MIEYIGIGVAVAGAASAAAGAVMAYRSSKNIGNNEFMGYEGRRSSAGGSSASSGRSEEPKRTEPARTQRAKPIRPGGDPAVPTPPARTAARAHRSPAMTRQAPAVSR